MKEFPQSPDDSLIARYLAGECPPAEEESVREWLGGSEGSSGGLSAFAAHVENERSLPESSTVGAWDDFVHAKSASVRGISKYSSQSLRRRVGLAAAAACMLVAVYYAPSVIHKTQATNRTLTYSTAIAQRAKINLPDGSSVLLAPGSRIAYSSGFGDKDRTVQLQGQALFTVVKDGYPPFIVNANNVSARVLGTTFDVRAYSEDNTVRVVVAEGKIAIVGTPGTTPDGWRPLDNTVLSVGDMAIVPNNGNAIITHNTNITDMLAWTDSRLVFRNVPLRNVLSDFYRMHGIKVQTSSAQMGERLVTGSISNMTPNDAINMLAGVLSLRAERRGNITLLME